MNINTKYEVSMIMYVDMRANKRKVPKNLPIKNYKSDLIFNVHILGAYVHIHIKYEVSIFNPVARRDVSNDTDDDDNCARRTSHGYIGSLCIIPNESKILFSIFELDINTKQ